MVNAYYLPMSTTGEDRVVTYITFFVYMVLCPESSTAVYLYERRFEAMRINENEPDSLNVVVNY